MLDYMHRLEKHKEGRKVAHLHLSLLRPINRRDQHIRTAAGNFDSMVTSMDAQVFTVKNSDIFVIYKDTVHHQVETAVQQIRYLFDDDPLVSEEQASDQKFTTWYDAEQEFDAVLQSVQNLAQAEKKRQSEVRGRMDARAALKAKQEKGEPLTPKVLARVETALSRADLSNLVRRQFACSVTPKGAPEQLFSELFISIKDLRETLLPGVDLTSNRWLFQHLTQTLDLRVLALLTRRPEEASRRPTSLNLNVDTLLSQSFINFDEALKEGAQQGIVIEMQAFDVFADVGAFQFSREFARKKGYRLCLDGLTQQSFTLFDREQLGFDLLKLFWNETMQVGSEGEQIAALAEAAKAAGPNRVILAHCDNERAIEYGYSVGITMFQGRYVDQVLRPGAAARN